MAPVRLFVGAILVALFALAVATVAPGVIATFEAPRAERH